MYEIGKSFRFEASHILPAHDGKCARLHGHSWLVTITLRSEVTVLSGPQTGMVADFSMLSLYMKPILDTHLDHRHLNDLDIYPTSENVARWIHDRLKIDLPYELGAMLYAVKVHETCTSAATYYTDGAR